MTDPPRFDLRLATPDDVDELAENLAQGFTTYREFAPQGWEPPPRERERGYIQDNLGHPDVWTLLARTDGEPVGHVAFMASSRSWAPGASPELAHFWHLWVRRPFWGTGVARALHERAVGEARARGFTELRLFTPAGQARARAFYEREGWTLRGEPFEAGLGLPVVEYRLDLAR
jgi:GNAT superfamily N-acetyltransferase